MDTQTAIVTAAKRAEKATLLAMKKYRTGRVVHEDDLTGVLVGLLDSELDGNIDGLIWDTSIFKHRAGSANEEGHFGADILIHIKLKTPELYYSKGIFIQAKRAEPGHSLSTKDHKNLVDQCNKMLKFTPASFVFNYTKSELRCGSASKIAGSIDKDLNNNCNWTAYRFFLEFFRCNVGDQNLTSAIIDDIKINGIDDFPYIVDIKATDERMVSADLG